MLSYSYKRRSALHGLLFLAIFLTCQTTAVAQQLETLRSSANRLRLYPDSIKRDQVNTEQQDFKNQLRAWFEPYVQTGGTSETALAIIEGSLNQQLHDAGLTVETFPHQGQLGFFEKVKISSLYERSPYLLVRAGAMVPACGYDEFFYIYRRDGSTWRRYLEFDGQDKPTSLRIFDIHVSPPDSSGDRLLLVASTVNACMSRWHTMYFDVFKIGPPQPVSLVKDNRFASIDEPYKLRLEPADVLVEFSGDSMDGAALERLHVLHYSINGTNAERVDPVALRPEDFVEEWITRSWPESLRWSDAGQLANLEALHSKLNAQRLSGEFWFAQRCMSKTDWQVAFQSYKPEFVTYFLVRQEATFDFKMLDISEKRQSGCPGETPAHLTHPTLFTSK
jgi:hypothetical protein